MTIAEIVRYEEGAMWRMRSQAQFDYILANLIGISSARMMSKEVTYPLIEDTYPFLFEKKEEESPIIDDDTTTRSINNFLAAAQRINAAKRKNGGEQK